MKLREFIKGICVVILIISGVVAAFAWGEDRPTDLTHGMRWGAVMTGIVAIAVFVWQHLKHDEARDYLAEISAPYFDRGGFCFSIRTIESDGLCFVQAFFQNRHDRKCRGQVALRPKKSISRGAKIMEPIALAVDCPAGGFGVVTVPVGLPLAVQGQQIEFEIGASVDYPEGRGRTLRFQDGLVIRSDTNFGDTFGDTLTVLGALGGAVVWSTPASVVVRLPTGVEEKLPETALPETVVHWKLGDQPLGGLA